MEYLTVKWLHILSATLLFGTGLGSAFYKFMSDRGGDPQAMAQTNRLVVLADWMFTTPTVILQPVTGVWLMQIAGYPLASPWLLLSILLYLVAGACWLPVVWLQIRMRDLSLAAAAEGRVPGRDYFALARLWLWLGVPAFVAILGVYWLMVVKPALWA